MTLAQLLNPSRVLPDLKATEAWAAINEMVSHLVENGDLPEAGREAVLEAFRQREDQCSTGIGCGIAIPHVYSEDITEVVTAFGRSVDGIDFCSLDSNPVKFVVLVVVPKDKYKAHLRTLAAIAKALNPCSVRQGLEGAGSAEEIMTVLGGPVLRA